MGTTKQSRSITGNENCFTKVVGKHRRRFIHGKAPATDNDSNLKAAHRLSYVYVGNVDVNVTSADLHVYLQNKFPQRNFSAFKVTINADLFL